jgi:hypothetical protein
VPKVCLTSSQEWGLVQVLFSTAKARDAAYDPRHLSLDALLIEGCGGFSRVELGIRACMWTLRRVGGLEATSNVVH